MGGHWNADGHEYPPEIRIMLAEIEESISPDRPLLSLAFVKHVIRTDSRTAPSCEAFKTSNMDRLRMQRIGTMVFL